MFKPPLARPQKLSPSGIDSGLILGVYREAQIPHLGASGPRLDQSRFNQNKLLRLFPLKTGFIGEKPNVPVSFFGRLLSNFFDFALNKSTFGLVCFGIGRSSFYLPYTKYYIPHTTF